jgi:hypothetical protein
MRPIILSLVLAATSATSTVAFAEGATTDSSLNEILLSAAAADFAAHGPKSNAFREVHLRYLQGDSDSGVHMLCGEFLQSSTDTWVAFATIKTSPYEQWIGGTASAWCQQAAPADPSAKDLAPELRAKITSAATPGTL